MKSCNHVHRSLYATWPISTIFTGTSKMLLRHHLLHMKSSCFVDRQQGSVYQKLNSSYDTSKIHTKQDEHLIFEPVYVRYVHSTWKNLSGHDPEITIISAFKQGFLFKKKKTHTNSLYKWNHQILAKMYFITTYHWRNSIPYFKWVIKIRI